MHYVQYVGAWSWGKESRCKNQIIIILILHVHIFSRIVASTAWSKTTSQLVGCAKILNTPRMDHPTLRFILRLGRRQQIQCAQHRSLFRDSAIVNNISKTSHAVLMILQVGCVQQVQWQNWQQQHVRVNEMNNQTLYTTLSTTSCMLCAHLLRYQLHLEDWEDVEKDQREKHYQICIWEDLKEGTSWNLWGRPHSEVRIFHDLHQLD